MSNVTKCAACGKDGDGMKACTACKRVKYCDVNCQRAHRPRHKKECKKRAAEIFDEALFTEHQEEEDCPICFLPLPRTDQTIYNSCCGKSICGGCVVAIVHASGNEKNPFDGVCPFCREPRSRTGEYERLTRRMDANDAKAYHTLAGSYAAGTNGMPVDKNKELELCFKAVDLGCAIANFNIGNAYYWGGVVEKNMKKAKHHWELAAMAGSVEARHNLGGLEGNERNYSRALKHDVIAARAGMEESLERVKQLFLNGVATKDEYERSLRGYQESQDKKKSDWREKAQNRKADWREKARKSRSTE